MPAQNNIIAALNRCKHRVNEGQQQTLFPEMFGNNSQNDAEYWLISDLQNIFGPQYFDMSTPTTERDGILRSAMNYEPVNKYVDRAKKHTNIGISEHAQIQRTFFDSHAITINNSYSININNGTKMFYNAPDKQLSRYACWCMFKSHNTTDAILPCTYFVMPGASDMEIYDTAQYFLRIPSQQALAHTRKRINGMLHQNGFQFGIYNDMIVRAFFGGKHVADIKAEHGIPMNKCDSIISHLGAPALDAMNTALRSILHAVNHQRYLNRDIMTDIITTKMHAGRMALAQRCSLPEDNLYPDTTSAAQQKLQRREKEFIRQYVAVKLR